MPENKVRTNRIKARFNAFLPKGSIDWMLVVIVAVLICFGLIMLYSASSYSERINDRSGFGTVSKQAMCAGIGAVGMFFIMLLPYDRFNKPYIIKRTGKKSRYSRWAKFTFILFIFSCLLTFAVLSPLGYGGDETGAARWINLGPMSLQPSEAIKVTIIMVMASVICSKINLLNDWKEYFKILILPIGAMGIVAVVTKDLSTGATIFVIGFIMLYLVCPRKKFIVITILILIGLFIILILIQPYRIQRVLSLFNPTADAQGDNYQVTQGLYAIGSGGFFGKGLGKSTQKMGPLPESQNDMIFSIICEELGVCGGLVLIALYVLLILRMIKIFDKTTDLHGRLVVGGVSTHLAVQTIVNMGVVTGIIPNTGIPLPFISSGGTSLIFTMAEIGLVLSVCRSNALKEFRSSY